MDKFSYNFLEKIYKEIKEEGYRIVDFTSATGIGKELIVRHDIDMSLEYAYRMACFEKSHGIFASYFILLNSDFYNPYSLESKALIHKIKELGHFVYLHFDSTIYNNKNDDELEFYIQKELFRLAEITGIETNVISFHRPVSHLFNCGIGAGIISAYDKTFFTDFKYISDSRMEWKENPLDVLKKEERVQLLIHPIWYHDKSQSRCEIIEGLLKSKQECMVKSLQGNIKDFYEFINHKESEK